MRDSEVFEELLLKARFSVQEGDVACLLVLVKCIRAVALLRIAWMSRAVRSNSVENGPMYIIALSNAPTVPLLV